MWGSLRLAPIKSLHLAIIPLCLVAQRNLSIRGRGVNTNKIHSQKSDILDPLEQGTPLRNGIQFQQNLVDTICKSGGGMGSLELGNDQSPSTCSGRQPPWRAAVSLAENITHVALPTP